MKKETKKEEKELVKVYRSTNKRMAVIIAMSNEKLTRAELIDRLVKAYKIPS